MVCDRYQMFIDPRHDFFIGFDSIFIALHHPVKQICPRSITRYIAQSKHFLKVPNERFGFLIYLGESGPQIVQVHFLLHVIIR